MADYQYLLHITSGRLYSDTAGVIAATPWGFTLHLSKGQITVLRQCCDSFQAAPVVAAAEPFHKGDRDCAACGKNVYPLQDNRHMLVWREMSYEIVEQWLTESKRVNPLEQVLLVQEFSAELRSWLYRRTVHVPKFTEFFRK